MTLTNARCLVIAALGLSSCTVYLHDDEHEMRRAIDSYRIENDGHHARTMEARSMSEVMDELTRHEHAAAMHFDWMDQRMDEMAMHCWASGMGVLYDRRYDLDERLLDHLAAMRGALDLGAAGLECGGYWAEVEAVLDDMRGALDSMMCH